MVTTDTTEEVQGWVLCREIVRQKAVVDSLKASGQQTKGWILLSWVLTFVSMTVAFAVVGAFALGLVPLALVGFLALLRADTAVPSISE